MTPPRLPIEPATLYAECFSLALRRAARAVSRRYDEAFAPLELNNGQFTMLALLASSAVRIQKIADVLVMDRTTVTAVLKPLQRRKLVVVNVAKDDARARDASITPAGRVLLAQAMPLWRELQGSMTKTLSARDAKALRAQLVRLT